ncbi:NERD domain-containing protein [Alkalibacillus aidingensis]|uniref:NERD domain-containing protein n=1 Tax=Alkalibacillus aidingensis TaxID=2747607 RepID=UPI0016609F59|nr:NERD domain-containing protein [Alkalibacillus aidingensis]
MAQLIKLQDYISRYQIDVFRYPGQFIRLKKENYHGILEQWMQQNEQQIADQEEERPRDSLFSKLFKRTKEVDKEFESNREQSLPQSEVELKQVFLDKIFQFQLKWASSTLQEVSFLDRSYQYNDKLQELLKRLPDTYLVLFEPIFKLKNALLEAEIIIITPIEILCITWLEDRGNEQISYIPLDQRTWLKKTKSRKETTVNPNISLKRMEGAINSILRHDELSFPIKKMVLTNQHLITDHHSPYKTEYIDANNFEDWVNQHRQMSFPLKFQQLKVAETLLKHTQITSIKRPEWEDDEDDQSVFQSQTFEDNQ